jgi:hypothetical protein
VTSGLQSTVFLGATSVPPTTSGPVITIIGGPGATANAVGSHNDSSDFFGIVLVVLAIAAAIAVVRRIFGRGRGVESSTER